MFETELNNARHSEQFAGRLLSWIACYHRGYVPIIAYINIPKIKLVI